MWSNKALSTDVQEKISREKVKELKWSINDFEWHLPSGPIDKILLDKFNNG